MIPKHVSKATLDFMGEMELLIRRMHDPLTAQRFHDLQECLNLLLDPIKRAAFDQKVKARLATKARTAAFDLKRKAGVDELSRREEAYKRFKQDERKKEVDKANEMERLKSESGKLMQERKLAQEKARKEEVERQRAQERAMADAGEHTLRASSLEAY